MFYELRPNDDEKADKKKKSRPREHTEMTMQINFYWLQQFFIAPSRGVSHIFCGIRAKKG